MMKLIYLSKENKETNNTLAENVFCFLRDLEQEYPNFRNWYFNKVIPDLAIQKREILIFLDNSEICAVAILKMGIIEKKICTLRVKENYQNKGIATDLLNESIRILGTNTPLITVSSNKLPQFEKLFKKFSFKLESRMDNYYKLGSTECCFNGTLPAKKDINLCKVFIYLPIIYQKQYSR